MSGAAIDPRFDTGPGVVTRDRGAAHGVARARRRARSPLLAALVALMVLLFILPQSLVFIEPGHGGVLWRRFGGGTAFEPALGEGTHLVLPWDKVYVYDLRLQSWEANLQTVTADGLAISLDVVLRFRLSASNLAFLHASVGPDYVAKLIRPQVEAVVHELVALYPIEQVLGALRTEIQRATLTALTDRGRLNSMGRLDPFTGTDARDPPMGSAATVGTPSAATGGTVNVDATTLNRALALVQDILISRIVMPDRVRAAIEAKLEQNQRAQEYEYRLAAERAESERKVIEADGIRRAQEMIAGSLTPGYLTYRGIEATLALAASPNAKIVLIGGANGLPLILNTGDGPSPGGSPPLLNQLPRAAATDPASAPLPGTAFPPPAALPALPIAPPRVP